MTIDIFAIPAGGLRAALRRELSTMMAMAALVLLAPARALAAEDDASNLAGDIVVTAQKRAENVLDVPISISAFSEETLDAARVDDAQDLQFVTPGLVMNKTGTGNAPYLRGIGTRFAPPGLEPSIATYIEDRYIANAKSTNRDLSEVERVEVVKGPQGTLYGRNATGGAIRLITRDVTDRTEGYGRASFGNYDFWSIAAGLNVPLSEDFGVRVYGSHRDRKGTARNLVPAPARRRTNDINDETFGLKAKWDISDSTVLRLGGSYWRKRDNENSATIDISPPGLSASVDVQGGLTGEKSSNTVATAIALPSDIKDYSAFAKLDIDLGNVEFSSITTFARQDTFSTQDTDGTSLVVSDAYVWEDNDDFSQEFRFASSDSGPLSWVFGLYGYNQSLINRTRLLVGGARPIAPSGEQDVDTTALAAYGQARLELGDAFAVLLGGRYSYERKKVRNTIAGPTELFAVADTPAGLVALLPYSDTQSWKKFTPKITIEYKLGSTLLYATYATGFKSGGFNSPAATSPVLRPETLDMFEVGAKGTALGRKLTYEASAFSYKYSDLQVNRSVDGIVSRTENAADARIWGIDANLSLRPSDAFTLTAGGAWVKSEYRNYLAGIRQFQPGPGTVSRSFNAEGHPLLNAPEFSGFVSASYVVPVGSGTIPLSVTYSYKSATYFDFVTQPQTSGARQGAFGILNGQIGYTAPGERWSAALWGKNLTNKRYLNEFVITANGIRGSYDDPRTFGIDLRYNF